MTTVTHEDIRALKYCNRGARQFFERHGLDWSDFLVNGIGADRLRQIDDAMAAMAIERAERREAASGQV